MDHSRKLAEALKRVRSKMEKNGEIHILHTSQIQRSDRELLLHARWLEEIIKGWYLVTRPDAPLGDSTPWYASFWDFLKLYLEKLYKKNYCLSAETSLDLLVGDLTIPRQIIAIGKRGSGTALKLPYQTSILVYSDPERLNFEKQDFRGLQIMPLALAILRVTPTYFINAPQKAEIAIRSLENISELLDCILRYNFITPAERLLGAFRFLDIKQMAHDLEEGLSRVGIKVKAINPFVNETPFVKSSELKTPHALRIQAMWSNFREAVIQNFPSAKSRPKNISKCLERIEELYTLDAYNSLSIEGYQVTENLIERVQKGLWSPEEIPKDTESRNALAARGYFEAFQKVKASIAQSLRNKNVAEVVQNDLSGWFQALFGTSVQAGILSPADLYGWRRSQVYIRGSRHTPLSPAYLREAMETFFACLKGEPHPAVQAILGHFFFVYIHPYMDGNGRIARFLMNTLLVSGGYPWTIIHVTHRKEYFAALEKASVDQDIVPFSRFVASQMNS